MSRFKDYLIIEKIGFDKLPPGWTRSSLTKFARSLTGKTKSDPEGFWTECYNRLKDKPEFGEEGAKKFCSSLKDEYLGTTKWRGKKGD